MRHETGIQWTHVPGYIGATWNPTTGCTRVSPGCDHCYAFTLHDQRYVVNRDHARKYAMTPETYRRSLANGVDLPPLPMAPQYDVPFSQVQVLDYDRLTEPLHRKAPRAYFVDSMSDLFHEAVPDEVIDGVFAVMALSPQHLFMILTKRPERMRQYLSPGRAHPVGLAALGITLSSLARNRRSRVGAGTTLAGDVAHLEAWPLPNVWIGTSVEDQARADERIPLLLDTPAAVRFLSMEPLLGAVDLPRSWLRGIAGENTPVVSWVIVGGESGKGARPFDLRWAQSLRDQCAAAGVPFFMKQLGSHPVAPIPWDKIGLAGIPLSQEPVQIVGYKHSHAANPDEWPEDLRVREWPAVVPRVED